MHMSPSRVIDQVDEKAFGLSMPLQNSGTIEYYYLGIFF
jgi:hypothetical protein